MVTRVFAYNGRVLSEEGPNLNAGQVVVRAWERDTRPTSSAPIVGTPPNGYFLLRLGLTLGEPSPARLAASTLTPAVLAYAPASVRATLKTASNQRIIRESRVILPRSRVDVRDLGDDAARLVLPGSAAEPNDGVGSDAVVAVDADELVRPALAGSPIVVDVPPLQLLADEPEPGGAFDGGGVVGPATQSLPDTFFDEVRFANAIWTHVADDVANFAVGRSSIWVTRTDGVLQQLALHPLGSGDGLPSYTPFLPPAALAVSSDPSDPTPRGDVAWVVLQTTGAVIGYYGSDVLQAEGLFGVRDIAAAAGIPPQLDGVTNVWVLNEAAQLGVLVGAAGQWFVAPSDSTRGMVFDSITVEKLLRGSLASSGRWLATRGGRLFQQTSGLAVEVPAPKDIARVARTEGAFFALAGKANSGGARRIFRFNSELGKWLEQEGRAREIETGYDGTLWLTDGEQRLFASGLRVLGANVNTRELPVGAATAPSMPADYGEFFKLAELSLMQLGAAQYPALLAEAISRLRSIGGSGQAALANYPLFIAASEASEPDDDEEAVVNLVESWFTPSSGAESVAVLAPAFTSTLQLPTSLADFASDPGIPALFTNNAFQGKYVVDVKSFLERVGVERIRYFSIGNEVDVFAGAVEAATQGAVSAGSVLASYAEFSRRVIPLLTKLFPSVRFSLSCTLQGAALRPVECAELYETASVILLTYYAVDSQYSVLSANDYRNEFPGSVDVLLDAFRMRFPELRAPTMALQEIAIPSSEFVGSSEAQQAEFVRYVLREWVSRGADWDFLSWFPLGDYWFDPNLQVVEATGQDPPYAIVRQPGDPIPAALPNGKPYVGTGNLLAPFFGAGVNPPLSEAGKVQASTTSYRKQCEFLWVRLHLGRAHLVEITQEPVSESKTDRSIHGR